MGSSEEGTDSGAGEVVVVGSLNVDLVYRLDRRPEPGETVVGHTLEHRPGGKGANQAAAAARAGGRVRMVGAVGADQYGRAYLDGLRAQGVDTSGVAVLGGVPTGVALVSVTPDGENSIVVIAGANEHVRPDRLLPPATRRGDVVVCQLELPVETVVAAGHLTAMAGARFVLNPSPIRPLPADLLALCDPLVVNVHEAHHLLPMGHDQRARTGGGDGGAGLAAGLLELGPSSVVVTLGRDGAVWAERDRSGTCVPLHVAAPSVEVVDTTGAGDAFTGALAAALAMGGETVPALRAAVLAGSAAATWTGAQPWRLDAPDSTRR